METTQGRFRILVVDDEEWGCRTLQKILSKHYEVACALSVAEAKKAQPLNQFHGAIVDYHMPGESGIVLIDDLKHHLPKDRVILLTADDTLKGDEDPRYTFFEKPLDVKKLVAYLSEALLVKPPSEGP